MKNPFRKKGKMPYMLTKGAMYLITDAKKEEFEPYLRKFAGDLAKQYTNIPYNDATRTHYKHNFGKKGADIDAGMVLHFWTQVYKGLEFLIIRDGSGFVQCIVDENNIKKEIFEIAKSITQDKR